MTPPPCFSTGAALQPRLSAPFSSSRARLTLTRQASLGGSVGRGRGVPGVRTFRPQRPVTVSATGDARGLMCRGVASSVVCALSGALLSTLRLNTDSAVRALARFSHRASSCGMGALRDPTQFALPGPGRGGAAIRSRPLRSTCFDAPSSPFGFHPERNRVRACDAAAPRGALGADPPRLVVICDGWRGLHRKHSDL